MISKTVKKPVSEPAKIVIPTYGFESRLALDKNYITELHAIRLEEKRATERWQKHDIDETNYRYRMSLLTARKNAIDVKYADAYCKLCQL